MGASIKKLSAQARIELGIAEMFAGKRWAYAAVCRDGHWGLGIAVQGEAGYNPIPLFWCSIPCGEFAADAMFNHAEELNRELGLADREAAYIVASTMHMLRPLWS